jgi:fructose-bisphosphate aldolase class I
MDELYKIAEALVASKKGILAADESTGTIEKRFGEVGLTSDPELNRKYRAMLFTTAEIDKYLSGVIMFDETVRQRTSPPVSESKGFTFPEYLERRGIIPGIKVDEGKEPAPNSPDESLTKGLDGLADRLKEYKGMGLKFTKWRAEIKISEKLPSTEVINENSTRLAKYAKTAQDEGFVPIVEPEVIRDGGHDLAKCEEVTRTVLRSLFSELERKEVDLKAMLLKVNMVTNGKDNSQKASPNEVASATVRVLRRVLPDELPGVVFLSGGQSPDEATDNLNAIVKHGNIASDKVPWELSFSFARALQGESLASWVGKDENINSAQEKFLDRLKKVSLARQGKLG